MHFKEAKGIVLKAVAEHYKDTVEKVLQCNGIGKEEIERRDEYGQTPLLLAAECCLEEIALTLIAFKADVTAQDDEGGTALHYAASEGNQIKLVDVLIKAEANVNAQNKHGETALHMAAQRKVADDKEVAKERLRLAKLLLKKANLKLVDEQGRTAFHQAVEAHNNPLVKLLAKNTASVPDHKGQTLLLKHPAEYQTVSDGSVELPPKEVTLQRELKEVLSPAELARARKDKNRINQPDAQGLTQLHYAVSADDTDKTRQLVLRGAHIDARERDRKRIGRTPLWSAIGEDYSEMTELLVTLGANVELEAPYTPLCWAVSRDRVALAKILIKGGADLQTKDSFGRCALEVAQRGGRRPVMEQFLTEQGATGGKSKSRRFYMHFNEAKGIILQAVTEHNNDTLERVLRQDEIGKEEIERRDEYGQTPLLLAAECCLEDIAHTLIAFKADVTAQDDEGGTALHYAASEGDQTKLVEALIRAEANVNAQNKHGETALHIVARSQVADDKKVANARLKVAKLLLKRADLKRVDEEGRTALHRAVEANNLPLVKLLAKTTPSIPDHKGQTPLLLATSRGYSEIAQLLEKRK